MPPLGRQVRLAAVLDDGQRVPARRRGESRPCRPAGRRDAPARSPACAASPRRRTRPDRSSACRGSTSTITGVAPAAITASAVNAAVMAGTMTSSPGADVERAQHQRDRVGAVADADGVRARRWRRRTRPRTPRPRGRARTSRARARARSPRGRRRRPRRAEIDEGNAARVRSRTPTCDASGT